MEVEVGLAVYLDATHKEEVELAALSEVVEVLATNKGVVIVAVEDYELTVGSVRSFGKEQGRGGDEGQSPTGGAGARTPRPRARQ